MASDFFTRRGAHYQTLSRFAGCHKAPLLWCSPRDLHRLRSFARSEEVQLLPSLTFRLLHFPGVTPQALQQALERLENIGVALAQERSLNSARRRHSHSDADATLDATSDTAAGDVASEEIGRRNSEGSGRRHSEGSSNVSSSSSSSNSSSGSSSNSDSNSGNGSGSNSNSSSSESNSASISINSSNAPDPEPAAGAAGVAGEGAAARATDTGAEAAALAPTASPSMSVDNGNNTGSDHDHGSDAGVIEHPAASDHSAVANRSTNDGIADERGGEQGEIGGLVSAAGAEGTAGAAPVPGEGGLPMARIFRLAIAVSCVTLDWVQTTVYVYPEYVMSVVHGSTFTLFLFETFTMFVTHACRTAAIHGATT